MVGDKLPRYTARLDDLAREGILLVVMVRDCRDVVQSTLDRAGREWAGKPWTHGGDPARLARHWVRQVRLIERSREHVLAVRYEDIATDPATSIAVLATYLSVDPAGFDPGIIRGGSVGKWRSRLSEDQVQAIMPVAGETMARWGYA